ncbi:MAG: cupin domain-containing protein [Sphaerochaetaceae bacterium]|jgi:mannose-6-phosphate isomerase-like protein (cupin superfamily)
MKFIRKLEGEMYTPSGHDSTVQSKKLFNPQNGSFKVDVHITTFAPGAGMSEEVHAENDHIFFILSGTLSIYQQGNLVGIISEGDAVYIPAGEKHEVRNTGNVDGVFIAVTTM